jgi:hypothetical protein
MDAIITNLPPNVGAILIENISIRVAHLAVFMSLSSELIYDDNVSGALLFWSEQVGSVWYLVRSYL